MYMKSGSKWYSIYFGTSDQDQWLRESKLIVETIAKNLKNNYLYLPELLAFLAKERNRLAIDLNHEDASFFGSFCTERMRGGECIRNGDVVREEVIPLVEELFKKQGKSEGNAVVVDFYNPFKHLFPKTDLQVKREKAIWASDVLHQNNIGKGNAYKELLNNYRYGYNEKLSQLVKEKEIIGLIYRTWNKYDTVGDYFSAQALYDDLLDWKPGDDINDFMTCAAKFSYFMTHCFFVRRGMAAITEWIIRGVALHHGIFLGDFKEDNIGWSWRALITPDINEYINWYRENCFDITAYFFSKDPLPTISANCSPMFFQLPNNTFKEVEMINNEKGCSP